MKFGVLRVILLGSFFCVCPFVDAVTKYACVSVNVGIGGGINAGYGGFGDGDFDINGISSGGMSQSASSEEFGMGIGGYGTIQHGIASPGSVPAPVSPNSFSPGISPLAAMQPAGGLFAQNTGGVGTASGLPNTAASLGGASHIVPQNPNPAAAAGSLGQMPLNQPAPGHPGVLLSGSLSCTDRPGTTILITKLVYGNGGIYSCSAPEQECDIVDYKDQEITPFCDGQIKCVVRTTGKLLPGCKVNSNFVHIEYECINAWSSFNICHDVKTVVREPEVFIMSPSFFQADSPPSKTCECILKGRYDNRIMAQYVHTDIYQAANQSCTESSVMFESKLSPNHTDVDKKTEVCGRRSLNNYLYRGDLRITFTDAASGQKSGFLSKLLVPSVGIGVQNEIAIECGPVRLSGEPTPSPDTVNRGMPGPFGPFSPMGQMNPQFHQSPRIPAPPVFEGIQPQTNWGVPPRAMSSGPVNWGGGPNWGGAPFPHPRFTSGNQDPQFPSTSSEPPSAWSRNQDPPTQRQNGHQVHFMGGNIRSTSSPVAPNPYGITINNAKNRAQHPRRSRFQSADIAIETQDAANVKSANNMVGYIIGGIGAVMTAFCALFISIYCTRRRQRILDRRASERSQQDTTPSPERVEESPIYSLSGVEVHSVQEGHVNSAYDGENEERNDGSVHFENVDLNDDNYLSLDEVEEGKRRREDGVSSSEAGTVQSLDVRVNSKCHLVQEDMAMYDNNV